MSSAANAGTLIRDLVKQVQAEEPVTRRKANTVTTVTGAVLTGLATTGTELVSSGLDLPPWFSMVVMALGLAATAFSVSKTKNGMTESVAERLELELSRLIDVNHEHVDAPPVYTVEATAPGDLLAAAEEMARRTIAAHRIE